MTGEMFPVISVERVEPAEANHLLVKWAHPLGACERPFHQDAHVLIAHGRAAACTMCSTATSSAVAPSVLTARTRRDRCDAGPGPRRPPGPSRRPLRHLPHHHPRRHPARPSGRRVHDLHHLRRGVPMPAHTHLPSGLVVIGASADADDLLAAVRAAASSHQALRVHGVASLDQLARVAAAVEGYGWHPRWRFPHVEHPDVVDVLLGGGL